MTGYSCEEKVSVSTALVEVDAAPALARSLQIDRDNNDFRLPESGDSPINLAGFSLRGWIKRPYVEPRLDGRDPYAREVSLPPRPGRRLRRQFGLSTDLNLRTWRGAEGDPFESWSWSNLDGPREARGETGNALFVKRAWLDEFLLSRGLSLIVKVAIDRDLTRGSRRYDSESGLYVDDYFRIFTYNARTGWADYRGDDPTREDARGGA